MKKYQEYDKLNYYLTLIFSGLVYPLINLLLALVLKKLIDSGIARNVSALKQTIFVCLLVCILLACAVFVSEQTKTNLATILVRNIENKFLIKLLQVI